MYFILKIKKNDHQNYQPLQVNNRILNKLTKIYHVIVHI